MSFLFAILVIFLIVHTSVQKKDFMRKHLTYCTDEDFALWAFGEEAWHKFLAYKCDHNGLKDAWNERHGDLLYVDASHIILESLKKMKEAYKNTQNPQPKAPE
jgi:hypothetical protein